MSAKKKVSLAVAKAAALMNWNPAKHPRGRDGKFIEVGDTVQVFSGPNGPQIATGVVKGGYFAPPPDGRMFIAVVTSDGETKWFRPKQIESAKVKATLPSGPIPVVDSKDEDFDWVDTAGTEIGIDQVAKMAKAPVTDAQGVPPAINPAAAAKGGSHTLPVGAVGYGGAYGYTTPEPLVGHKFQKTGESFVSQGYSYTPGTVKAPFGSGESDVDGTLVTNVDNGAYIFLAMSPGKAQELGVGDFGEFPDIPVVPDTGKDPLPSQVADIVEPSTTYKGYTLTPYQTTSQHAKMVEVADSEGNLQFKMTATHGDDPLYAAKKGVDTIAPVYAPTPSEAALPDPSAPKPVTPGVPSAPSTPQSLTSPDAIKLPKGKTPADVLMAIKTSAANKGLDEAWTNSMIQQALNDPNPVTAHKKLAEAMTYAKLGGKQRTRYKKLLDMHLGVTSDESEGVMVMPQGTTMHHTGELPGITGMKAVSGSGKQLNLTQGKAWLSQSVPKQPWQGQYADQDTAKKAAIQADLTARTMDTITIEGILAMPAPWYGEGGRMKSLRDAHANKAWESPGQLRRLSDGSWTIDPGATALPTAIKDGAAMDLTQENLELAMRAQLIRDLVQTWAATSNDHNPRSLAVQLAIEEEFGLKDVAPWSSLKAAQGDKEYAQNGAVYRAFVRAMYEATQERLKKDGITHVTVRRGMALPNSYQYTKGSTYEIALRPASSFTSNVSTASSFKHGGIVIQAIVPIERILGSAMTGFGCLNEYEWVVLGGVDQWKVMTN